MSEKIYAAVTIDFIQRMQHWALNREAAVVSSSWPSDGPIAHGNGFGPKVPLMLGRVHDTEMALGTLPIRYDQAVRQFWMYEGQSLRWHGRHRGIKYETFEVWVIKGHELLKSEFSVRSANWHRAHPERLVTA